MSKEPLTPLQEYLQRFVADNARQRARSSEGLALLISNAGDVNAGIAELEAISDEVLSKQGPDREREFDDSSKESDESQPGTGT